jgi:hypothetical protein
MEEKFHNNLLIFFHIFTSLVSKTTADTKILYRFNSLSLPGREAVSHASGFAVFP